MWRGVAKPRWAVVAVALLAGAVPAGVASASTRPALGRWSGTGKGGTVHFVVSRVGRSDVLSDLVEQCANGTPSVCDIPWRRNGEGPGFRSEAALGANGKIYDLIHVPHKARFAVDYRVHGRLHGDHGTVTDDKSGDGDESCLVRTAHVSRTGSATLVGANRRSAAAGWRLGRGHARSCCAGARALVAPTPGRKGEP